MTPEELERRMALLEARVELLVRVVAYLAGPDIEAVPVVEPDPVTPPWRITSTGGAL